ncbi:hypothetical protein B0H14DRAFT_2796740 [Mycena olivaceomarginata]|nr:hypothetical protein B0H14DRAFT_2796740 [Mycena olivaceomarginata]
MIIFRQLFIAVFIPLDRYKSPTRTLVARDRQTNPADGVARLLPLLLMNILLSVIHYRVVCECNAVSAATVIQTPGPSSPGPLPPRLLCGPVRRPLQSYSSNSAAKNSRFFLSSPPPTLPSKPASQKHNKPCRSLSIERGTRGYELVPMFQRLSRETSRHTSTARVRSGSALSRPFLYVCCKFLRADASSDWPSPFQPTS